MSAVIDQSSFELVQRSRIWRSKEARGIRDALQYYCERGVLADFSAGKLRLGRMTFVVSFPAGRAYRLLLDVDAGTVKLSGFLVDVNERSALFKELKNFLRAFGTAQVSPTLRLDPHKGEIHLEPENSGTALVVTVKDSEYEHCARRLVCLADEIRRTFLQESNYPAERRNTGFGALTLT